MSGSAVLNGLEKQTPGDVTPRNDDSVKVPRTIEEYMSMNSLSEWPHRLTSENLPDLREDLIDLSSQETLLDWLRDGVTVKRDSVEALREELAAFNSRLIALADKLLDMSCDADDALPAPDSEARERVTQPQESSRPTSARDVVARLRHLESRSVQNCQVPSFCTSEVSPLPGGLEARQILNDIFAMQPFTPTMKLFWKKVFMSEASVAMLHDAFWWMFIDRFQPEKTQERSKLFDRLSDTFVALCYSITAQVKDKVLRAYADCLAQAIYAVFARAFPASLHLFDHEFKQNLSNNTHEWITGLQPSAGGCLKWNIHLLELQDKPADNDVAELSLIVSGRTWGKPDFEGMHHAVQSVGTAVVPVDQDSLHTATKNDVSKTSTVDYEPLAFVGKSKESHPVGQGAELERVLFGLKGRSVLVSHFLKMRQLQAKEYHHRKVRHTRVKKIPPPNALTYNQLVEGIWQKHWEHKKRYYNRLDHIKAATEERIAKLQTALSASSSVMSDSYSDLSDDDSV